MVLGEGGEGRERGEKEPKLKGGSLETCPSGAGTFSVSMGEKSANPPCSSVEKGR